MGKRYWRSTLIYEILTEGESPFPDDMSELDMMSMCIDGAASGDTKSLKSVEVSREHIAVLLVNQRSDPSFLIEDWGEEDEAAFEEIKVGVDHIGEQDFQALDHCLGHGDPHLSHDWAMGLAVAGGVSAPKGFKFIMDAELTPVALVPDKLVEPFLKLLNQD